jgi:hypothetical protein
MIEVAFLIEIVVEFRYHLTGWPLRLATGTLIEIVKKFRRIP